MIDIVLALMAGFIVGYILKSHIENHERLLFMVKMRREIEKAHGISISIKHKGVNI